MKTTEAYLSADGMLHLSEKAAKDRDDDLLGQGLDGLLRLFELDISRNQEYKALLKVMNKRDALKSSINEILAVLNHDDSKDD